MQFFYYDNQDNTVKPICTLQIFYFFKFIYYFIYITSRNYFLLYNHKNYITKFTNTAQFGILKCSKSVFFFRHEISEINSA